MLPQRRMTAWILGWLVCVFLAWPNLNIQAETSSHGPGSPPPPVIPTVITSPLLHIRVSGSDQAHRLAWAAWAEQVAQPVIRLLNSTPRHVPHRVLCLELGAPQSISPSVSTSRWVITDGRIGQALRLEGWENLSRNEVQEWLVHLVLNEVLMDRQMPVARKEHPLDVPRWVAVGIARYTDFDQRARDGRLVIETMARKQAPRLADLMTWSFLPGTSAPEKAFCTIAVGWILSRPSGEEGLSRLLDAMSEGQTLAPATLLRPLRFSTVDDAERNWAHWLNRQERIIRLGAETPPSDQTKKLRDYLAISLADIQAIPGSPGKACEREDLIENRFAPWVTLLAAHKAETLRQFAIGKDQELREPLNAWIRWFDRLAKPGWAPAFLLRRQLQRCEAIQAACEARFQAREEWLSHIEAARERPFSLTKVSFPEHLLEKSALHDYVDRVELTVMANSNKISVQAGE